MSTADLIAALRRLALVDDLPECAQAADLIERLRGELAKWHRLRIVDTGWTTYWHSACVCGWGSGPQMSKPKALDAHAAHVASILDGSGT